MKHTVNSHRLAEVLAMKLFATRETLHQVPRPCRGREQKRMLSRLDEVFEMLKNKGRL